MRAERRRDLPPRREWYSTGDVCEAIGITWERLHYLLDRGRLPGCQERKGRTRQWTEAEVEAVMDAYRVFEEGYGK